LLAVQQSEINMLSLCSFVVCSTGHPQCRLSVGGKRATIIINSVSCEFNNALCCSAVFKPFCCSWEHLQDSDFKSVGGEVLQAFHDWVAAGAGSAGSSWSLEAVNHEGWRVNVDEGDGKRGWLLLRQSLHDPLLVLNVESDVAGGEY
jgi:hypothetical protein